MRVLGVRGFGCLVCTAVAAAAAGVSPAGSASSSGVLIIGDSVATGMLWHTDAVAVMQQGLAVDWDVAICRTLEGTSCPFDGERPPTLQAVVSQRGTVPPIVIVEMGYNDPAATFASSVDHAMTSLLAAGAQHVLWLTLHAAREPYPELNTVLTGAATRWPQLELVDWNAASVGHDNDWFQNDGVHLLEPGGLAMAHLLHAAVMRLVDPLHVVTHPLILAAGRAATVRLQAAGGAAPYRWRVASGRPPHGFHLLASGRARLDARRVARARFTLEVVDADGATADLTVQTR